MNTDWTNTVDENAPLPEYPRPQLVRDSWISLNGLWEYAITDSKVIPEEFDGLICVPFSPETRLSGVQKQLEPGKYLWYSRDVELPEGFAGKRLILHFGAVDQIADVWVNAKQVATHVGGYLPFEADISSAVGGGSYFSLVVRVTDDTDKLWHTRGKQRTRRGGIWYSRQSGIWQSVWLEAAPQSYVRGLRITPFFDEAEVEISADIVGRDSAVAHFNGGDYTLPAVIPVPDFVPWSPETPRLYDFTVTCGEDEVKSYFAMRKFSVGTDEKGAVRLMLNNKPYFHNGVLDQGYWPDGLYTAPTDEALSYDIRVAKASGFNMIRKHCKVEPLRWYYHCDRLGMLVWQDMPNGGRRYSRFATGKPAFDAHLNDHAYAIFGRSDELGRREFQNELVDMVNNLYNCPCVAMWVLFNEGWGQFDSRELCDAVRFVDNTRTIDHASGWHDQGAGDVKSEHVYSHAYKFRPDKKGRAVVLSEFGGYAHQVVGHTFGNKEYGYKKFDMPVQLEIGLEELFSSEILPAREQGLAASVYTQMSDVEDEINGLLTYDRRVVKTAPETMRRIMKPEKK